MIEKPVRAGAYLWSRTHAVTALHNNKVIPDWLANLLIVGLAAIVLGLPMLIYGPMIRGHDTMEHLNFSRHFADQFWGGEWYPRWLLDMNHGLGSPSFFVYPPLPSYVVTLLRPAGILFHVSAFRLQEFLALFGSGLTAFVWVRTMARRQIALVCAVLYMLMPYHLSVDFYRRTALPECWALLWIPLILYFTVNVSRRRGSVLGLALAFALLILSHLVSVLIFFLIPPLVALVFSVPGQKLQSVVRVTLGMALGTALSLFYLLPAVLHSKNFPVSRLFTSYTYGLFYNLVGMAKVQPGTIRTITFTVLDMALFVVICGAATLYEQWSQTKKSTIFWLLVCLVPIFLMTKLSYPLWKQAPLFYAGIQFPWRLNILVCVGVLPIVATFLSSPSRRMTTSSQALPLALLVVVIASWCAAYAQVCRHYKTESYPLTSPTVSEDDGWFDAWSPPETDQQSALDASRGPQARFLNAEGVVHIILWKARHIEVQTSSETGGAIMVNQFYYPHWTAALIGPHAAARTLKIDVALPEGLLEVQVPPGLQSIRFDIPVDTPERAGMWISALFAVVLAIWCLRLTCAILRPHRADGL